MGEWETLVSGRGDWGWSEVLDGGQVELSREDAMILQNFSFWILKALGLMKVHLCAVLWTGLCVGWSSDVYVDMQDLIIDIY